MDGMTELTKNNLTDMTMYHTSLGQCCLNHLESKKVDFPIISSQRTLIGGSCLESFRFDHKHFKLCVNFTVN